MMYCTIIAQNYLAQALALGASLLVHEPTNHLFTLLIDGPADLDGVEFPGNVTFGDPAMLDIDPRLLLNMKVYYDVVEFATALKPALLLKLLEADDQVVYLDPDTFLLSPLLELPTAIHDSPGILLTPHFLQPIPAESTYISEVHNLTVGAYNLGFCAVSRKGRPFLKWWWDHLKAECLIYPLLGLFVDQKWVDVGTSLFPYQALRHPGYNVAVWNLHERPLVRKNGCIAIGISGEPLRLFHFSGFDANVPSELSSRLSISTSGIRSSSLVLDSLCDEYASVLREMQARTALTVDYKYARDLDGRPLTTRLRRAYRTASLDEVLPSPFLPEHRAAFKTWRRRSSGRRLRNLGADAALALKYVLPDQYKRAVSVAPRTFRATRKALLAGSRVRR